MEIKAYFRFFSRTWKTIVLFFVVTLGATAFLTFNTMKVYQATTTYIVRLSALSADDRTAISALDTLSNRVEIATTYAKVAKSRLIKEQASTKLGLTAKQSSELTILTQILPGTNILEITVQGNDPKIVRDFANVLGEQAVLYVQNLYEVYALELLDDAQLPKNQIKPDVTNNLMLGAVFGLVLGIVFALLMEYLRSPFETSAGFNILDEQTGTYNTRFFHLRLHQEMNRARRNEGVLTVAMVNIDHRRLLDSGSAQGRLGAMRSVVSMFGKNLRDEDVMAPFSDTELAILLPDLDAKAAKTVVERLLELVAMLSVDLGAGDQAANLQGAAGVAPYFSGDNATMDELISRSRGALDSMRDSTYGRVMISGESAINDIQSAKRISK